MKKHDEQNRQPRTSRQGVATESARPDPQELDRARRELGHFCEVAAARTMAVTQNRAGAKVGGA